MKQVKRAIAEYIGGMKTVSIQSMTEVTEDTVNAIQKELTNQYKDVVISKLFQAMLYAGDEGRTFYVVDVKDWDSVVIELDSNDQAHVVTDVVNDKDPQVILAVLEALCPEWQEQIAEEASEPVMDSVKKEIMEIQLSQDLDGLKKIAASLRSMELTARKAKQWTVAGSLDNYAAQLEELISCDNGEAGLEAFVTVFKNK